MCQDLGALLTALSGVPDIDPRVSDVSDARKAQLVLQLMRISARAFHAMFWSAASGGHREWLID